MRAGTTDIYDIVALMYHDALEDAPEFKDLKTSEDKKAALIGKMCDHTQNLMTSENREWDYKLRMIEATENFYLPLAITLGGNTRELALNMSNIIEEMKSDLWNTFETRNGEIYLKNTKNQISKKDLQKND